MPRCPIALACGRSHAGPGARRPAALLLQPEPAWAGEWASPPSHRRDGPAARSRSPGCGRRDPGPAAWPGRVSALRALPVPRRPPGPGQCGIPGRRADLWHAVPVTVTDQPLRGSLSQLSTVTFRDPGPAESAARSVTPSHWQSESDGHGHCHADSEYAMIISDRPTVRPGPRPPAPRPA